MSARRVRRKQSRRKRSDSPDPAAPPLFDLAPYERFFEDPLIRPREHPIWTESKAKLIERYLYYFLMITRHGTYVDGFAGPQHPDKPETWAAKLVLELEPRWLRHFYLFDNDRDQFERLSALRDMTAAGRDVQIEQADFNEKVHELLSSGVIGPAEATFCLLDQRTFECDWATLKRLAEYKTGGNYKIELFYFLSAGWLGRSIAALRDTSKLQTWWGREDYERVRGLNHWAILEEILRRFKEELGYKSVKPWPIFKRQTGRTVMYHMLHATDHPHAPLLMSRAYDKAVLPKEPVAQLELDLRERKILT